ncbi:MAG: hypothetical protein E6K18_08175 [Methanobacteriota archaeon]|nr:MAG: hypothetical protein E6K18_08175 [Euryarchaeota archaeon]
MSFEVLFKHGILFKRYEWVAYRDMSPAHATQMLMNGWTIRWCENNEHQTLDVCGRARLREMAV